MSLSEPVTPSEYEEFEATVKMLDSIKFSERRISQRKTCEKKESPEAAAVDLSMKRKIDSLDVVLREIDNFGLQSSIEELRKLASSCPGRLLNDSNRKKVWPLLAENLLGSSNSDSEASSSSSDSDFESAVSTFLDDEDEDQSTSSDEIGEPSIDDLKLHKEWNQVELDVNRLLSRFPPYITKDKRQEMQDQLTPIIVRVLWQNKSFRYYQGFHDICITLVLVLGIKQGYKAAKAIGTKPSSAIYRYLTRSLEDSVMRDLNYMYVLIWNEDAALEKYMRMAGVGCMFALSWPLTWFSHSLTQYLQVVQFFDFFLSSDPMMPIYVAASLVLHRKREIMACEPEMPVIHHLLSRIPDNLNVDEVLSTASQLILSYPPSLVQGIYCDRYNEQLNEKEKKPGNRPKVNRYAVNAWFVAGAATAAVAYWVLTNYGSDPSFLV
ncbi:hypothetical protein L596_003105 [Steinernema carpocapsae]|uniref:Rab-GAP TBC domain-containing protein n=1 Tax=Steinernema carpocapsae TaxID=34508 RepID=A0A4U8URF4_STECR|nr:hypothetical protein L596_003105 [Steinernema carpocapsae]